MDSFTYRLRTLLVAFWTLLAVSTVPAVLAPAANAAIASPSPGCLALNDGSRDGIYSATRLRVSAGFTFAAGEQLLVTAGAPGYPGPLGVRLDITFDSSTIVTVSSGTFPATIAYTMPQELDDSAASIYWYLDSFFNTAMWTLSCIPYSAPAPGASPENDTPADAVQEVGLLLGHSCTNVDEASLDWGNAITGGWTSSWAQWINEGAGGAVCTRTIHYDQANRVWAARS